MKDYIFSSQEKDAEYKRLSLIESSFDEKSQKHLLKAGLKEGQDVLEVGLGAGSIALWISEKVGTSGSLLAVDLNTQYALSQYDVLEGNILDLEFSKKFDLIHLRYVLIHNLKAKEILTKLYTLLKPDGKLILEEPDFTLAKWMESLDLQACKRVSTAISKTFENKGLKPHYGSVSYISLEEVGFEIYDSTSYLHLCSGGENVAEVMYLSAIALEDEYIKTGCCTKEDIEVYKKECMDCESLAVHYASIAVIAHKNTKIKEEKTLIVDSEPPSLQDGIFEAKECMQIDDCFSLMKELRLNLNADSFSFLVQEQMKSGYKLFYLRKNSNIVSLVGVRISTNLAWGKHLYIDDFISSEVYRSRGYGKELLDYLKVLAYDEGCDEIHLDSGVQRFEAHKFYLRENFKISSHHISYKVEI